MKRITEVEFNTTVDLIKIEKKFTERSITEAEFNWIQLKKNTTLQWEV